MKKDDAKFFKRELEKLSNEVEGYTEDEFLQQLTRLKNILKPIKNDSIPELNAVTDLIYTSNFLIDGASESLAEHRMLVNKSDIEAVKRILSRINNIQARNKMDEKHNAGIILKYNVLGIMRGDMW